MDGLKSIDFMAVFAVSGSVALLAVQIHKHLHSEFMRQIQFEFGNERSQVKKKVRFLDDERERSICTKDDRKIKPWLTKNYGQQVMGRTPWNRLAFYKGRRMLCNRK